MIYGTKLKVIKQMKKLGILFLTVCLFFSCAHGNIMDFKKQMRKFVIGISEYGKRNNSNFLVIPQNGIELVSLHGQSLDQSHESYLDAIDGCGQEGLFYGYENDNQKTSSDDTAYLRGYLSIALKRGKKILVTDYCSGHLKMSDSYKKNGHAGYISFSANERELNNIPRFPIPIHGENNSAVTDLGKVKNFLYLINSEKYSSKWEFINAIRATNYDLLIMDLFFNDGVAFTAWEIEQLRNKANGGKRLVIAYMSIGEAENYRYYWQAQWTAGKPLWLDSENPQWEGNYKVKYWNKEWQGIIYGNDDSYLKKILDAGFDGVYLDIIDAFDYYESQ